MEPAPSAHLKPRAWIALTGLASGLGVLVMLALAPARREPPISIRGAAPSPDVAHGRSSWVYGRPDAPFTVIEYADLECPYCRAYFPVLRRWIAEHPQVNWEWRNLPLAMHEPAATEEASLAECAGEMGGDAAFWRAVAWIYGHTRGDGAGLPTAVPFPGMSSRNLRACLRTERPDEVIRAQVAAAAREDIRATPTLRLLDRKTGRSLTLQGPIAGDALLSAIDLLAAESASR
jgi:protein-disulfide isomerase